jgi:neutral ceramidase
VLIPSSELGWSPDVLPFQLLRVGNLAIAGVPAELTVQAGRRLRAALLSSLRGIGVTRVVTSGLANEYTGHVTTPEEYDTQQYEGASTLFGRLTLDAYLQIFGKLAGGMASGTAVDPGPTPADLSANQISLQTGVVYDDKRIIEKFGQVMVQPAASVVRGGSVFASFRAGHPKNDLKTNDSYFFVERKVNTIWATAAWDAMPETKMVWRRDLAPDCRACSFTDITWDVPLDAIPGVYRIRHRGAWKNGLNGSIAPYEGTSREFTLR